MKIIKLTESDLIKIVKQVLSEQVVQGNGDDPWEYKKEGNKYYARKKGGKNWVLTGGNAEQSIKTKIFGDKTSSTSKPKSTTKTTVTPKTTTTTTTQTKVVPNKVITSFNPIVVQKTDTLTPYSRDTLKLKGDFIAKDVNAAISLMGKISKKTFEQLNLAKSKNTFKGKSFIIINKDAAIASLFDGNYKFVTKSSITTGKSKDSGEIPIGFEEWINITLDWWKKNSKKDTKVSSWVNAHSSLIKSDNTIDYNKYKSGSDDFPYSYKALESTGKNYTPSGVFGVSSGSKSRYVGAPDIVNTFPLVDLKTAKKYPAAVHAYATTDRGKAIEKASSQDTELLKDYTRMGAGCVNVDKNFILNIQKYNPQYVVILPDSGGKVDLSVVPMETWSEKIGDLADRCVRSFSSLFN
jgi:hypothetical protein